MRHLAYVTLGRAGFKHAKAAFTVTIRLGPHGRAMLKRHRGRLALRLIISAPPAKTRRIAATLHAAH